MVVVTARFSVLLCCHQWLPKRGGLGVMAPTFQKYPLWSPTFAGESTKPRVRHFMIEKSNMTHRSLDFEIAVNHWLSCMRLYYCSTV